MRKGYALAASLMLIALGTWLIVLAALRGWFSPEQYRSLVSLTLVGGFAVVLVTGLLLSLLTTQDYRAVFTTMIVLLSLGLLLLGIFFGFMDMLVSDGAYKALVLSFLTCYGLAMILIGAVNYLLSQQVYRPYIRDLASSLPHIYGRYRA